MYHAFHSKRMALELRQCHEVVVMICYTSRALALMPHLQSAGVAVAAVPFVGAVACEVPAGAAFMAPATAAAAAHRGAAGPLRGGALPRNVADLPTAVALGAGVIAGAGCIWAAAGLAGGSCPPATAAAAGGL